MKAISASQLLNMLQSRVEDHLQQTISKYQNLSDAQLNKPSSTGGWSIAQCLDHLNSYGDYYLPQISKAVLNYAGKPGLTAKRSWLGNYFINMMDPDLPAKNYKAFKGHLPAPGLNGQEVASKFINQQEQLLELLKRASSVDLNKARIPISLTRLVRLKLCDTIEFLVMHNERHIRQANRNLILQ